MDKNTQRLFTVSVSSVVANNNRKLLIRERQKRDTAVKGLKRVISQALAFSTTWNPEVEKLTALIIVEAENALRDIDSLGFVWRYSWGVRISRSLRRLFT